MEDALPGSIQLKVSQALQQWSKWHAEVVRIPEVKSLLHGGQSNFSVLVSDGKNSWVLRIDGHDSQQLGLSRGAEWRVLQQAAERGIAPVPVYRNPELGVLISEYCAHDAEATHSMEDTGRLLRAIHDLPVVKFRLNPLDRARRYLAICGKHALPQELIEACDALTERPATLCHNDLLRANRLSIEGSLVAIDWEYAATGDPLFDLAVICEGDQLSDKERVELLTAWLGEAPGVEIRKQLDLQRVVYAHLANLWEQAVTELRNKN